MSLIFVYGTLKRGCHNHHFLAGQKFLGAAKTAPGYTLYALSGYPGMVPEKNDIEGVAGEVWSVDPDCLARLDDLEGLAHGLYRRSPVPLLPPFSDQCVEGYLYARSISDRRKLGTIWTE